MNGDISQFMFIKNVANMNKIHLFIKKYQVLIRKKYN